MSLFLAHIQPLQGPESRRSSNITCCSTESSYLERRPSAVTLGLTPHASRRPSANHPNANQCQPPMPSASASSALLAQPSIQVIQATPQTSPSANGRNAYNRWTSASLPPSAQNPTAQQQQQPQQRSTASSAMLSQQLRSKSLSLDRQPCSLDSVSVCTASTSSTTSNERPIRSASNNNNAAPAQMLALQQRSEAPLRSHQRNMAAATMATTTFSTAASSSGQQPSLRRAPLASISSFKISSVDYQDSDLKSLGSDSVFAESFYADTDDEMEPFSTDSDELTASDEQLPEKQQNQQHRSPQLRPRNNSAKSRPTAKCTTVHKSPSLRGRRILQRSATVFPSVESLPKTPTAPQQPLVQQPQQQRVLQPPVTSRSTAETIERSTPPSTRSLPAALRPSAVAVPAPQRRIVSALQRPETAATAAIAGINSTSSNSSTSAAACSRRKSAHSLSLSRPRSSCQPSAERSSAPVTTIATGTVHDALGRQANVIFEMPMLSAPSVDTSTTMPIANSDPANPGLDIDPSLPPGTARKWSRETLFWAHYYTTTRSAIVEYSFVINPLPWHLLWI